MRTGSFASTLVIGAALMQLLLSTVEWKICYPHPSAIVLLLPTSPVLFTPATASYFQLHIIDDVVVLHKEQKFFGKTRRQKASKSTSPKV
jgi:hypothetical protein